MVDSHLSIWSSHFWNAISFHAWANCKDIHLHSGLKIGKNVHQMYHEWLLDLPRGEKNICKKSGIRKTSSRLFMQHYRPFQWRECNFFFGHILKVIGRNFVNFTFFYQIVRALCDMAAVWNLPDYWLAELDSVANGIKNQWWTFCNCQLFIMMPFFPGRLTLSDSLGMFAMFRKRSLDLYQRVS